MGATASGSRIDQRGPHLRPCIELPGGPPSVCVSNCLIYSWDPAIAVSSTGTIYAAFMHGGGGDGRATSPVVDVSTNHGASFSHSYALPQPGGSASFGDRDFIAVGAHGELFVTWDYAPNASEVKVQCPPSGSCSYSNGDLNIVVQHSTNGGRTWSAIEAHRPRLSRQWGGPRPDRRAAERHLRRPLPADADEPDDARAQPRERVVHPLDQQRGHVVQARRGRGVGGDDLDGDVVDRR